MVRVVVTKERRCGRRKEGKVYLVGGDERSEEGTLLPVTFLDPPVPYQVTLHRTARIVMADPILRRMPMDAWWFGSSLNTEIKKAGRQWELSVFGMPINQRLQIGECAAAKAADEAINILASKLHWHDRMVEMFRKITVREISLIPGVVAEYECLQEALTNYAHKPSLDNLINVQAAVWRVGLSLPPKKRSTYATELSSMLALLGLPLDAVALQIKLLRGNQ